MIWVLFLKGECQKKSDFLILVSPRRSGVGLVAAAAGRGHGPGPARAPAGPGPGPGHRSGPVASTESGTTPARSVSKIGYRSFLGEIPISHLVPKSPKRVQKPAKSAEIRPPPIISQHLPRDSKGPLTPISIAGPYVFQRESFRILSGTLTAWVLDSSKRNR